MNLRILLLAMQLLTCVANNTRTSFLRRKEDTETVEIRKLHGSKGKGKGGKKCKKSRGGQGKGKGSPKQPKSSKSPSSKGKGKGSSKSPSSKGKGKGSSKQPKSSKSPKSKGGKGKSGYGDADCSLYECISAETREEDIREIIGSISGEIVTDGQSSALEWITNIDESTVDDDTACEYGLTIMQKYSLAVLYYSTNGDSWAGKDKWLTIYDECTWYGITCDGSGEIIGINLENNNLNGSLPKEIAIPSLESLRVYNNSLSDLPSEIGNLTSLKILDLEANQFSGTIFFDNFDHLAGSLEELRVSKNTFHGQVPDLSAFKSLRILWLAMNDFSGDLPESITKLSRLEQIKVYDNNLTGTIPKNIGHMDSLTDLDISGNFGISGGIPASIGKLKNLTLLGVKNCGLSGLIPDEFSNLTKLKMFDASNNDFSGDLPSTEKMENILNFSIENNSLTGPLPTFDGATELMFINLASNHFSGGLSSGLLSLPKLEILYLDSNKLTGSIPHSFGGSKTLKDLYLQDNNFEGSVPELNGALPSITELLLSTNDLTGSMPNSICDHREARGIEFRKLWADCTEDSNGDTKILCTCCECQ